MIYNSFKTFYPHNKEMQKKVEFQWHYFMHKILLHRSLPILESELYWYIIQRVYNNLIILIMKL